MDEKAESFVVVRSASTDTSREPFDPFVAREKTQWPTAAWPEFVKSIEEPPVEILTAEPL